MSNALLDSIKASQDNYNNLRAEVIAARDKAPSGSELHQQLDALRKQQSRWGKFLNEIVAAYNANERDGLGNRVEQFDTAMAQIRKNVDTLLTEPVEETDPVTTEAPPTRAMVSPNTDKSAPKTTERRPRRLRGTAVRIATTAQTDDTAK